MNTCYAATALSLALATTAGCSPLPDASRAQTLGEEYFRRLQRGNEQAIFALYSEKFYEATPREKWEQTFAKIHETLGEYEAHTLVNLQAKRMVGTNSGDYIVLLYDVRYSKRQAKETITVYAPLTGADPPSILGHDVRWDVVDD